MLFHHRQNSLSDFLLNKCICIIFRKLISNAKIKLTFPSCTIAKINSFLMKFFRNLYYLWKIKLYQSALCKRILCNCLL